MTLGAAAAAGVRLIVWCKACQHQVEPDPPRWPLGGPRTSVLDWRGQCVPSSGGEVDFVVSGTKPSGKDQSRR
jgi:hypothetical protein